jgi:hypothetical protein
MLGNFPQAFSCVALINTAYNLAQATDSEASHSRAVRTAASGEAVPLEWAARVLTPVTAVQGNLDHRHKTDERSR